MRNKEKRHGVLYGDEQLGPFPMHHLKQVDKPTNLITDEWERIDSREIPFIKAAMGEYGLAAQAAVYRGTGQRDLLSATYIEVATHLSTMKDNEVAPTKAPIPEDPAILSRHIKSYGYFLGADIMGICELPKSAVYKSDMAGKPVEVNYKFAIVIALEKDYRTEKASNGYDWIADPLSFQAYAHSSVVAITMANYIRRLGYPASAQYGPQWYEVQIPPLLLLAGIGEVCRAGIILNPFLGFSYKAAAVLTDLPLVPDKPIDFGLQDFCQHCKRCSTACPSQAIAKGDKIMYNGYETWKLDVQRCASFCLLNTRGSWCTNCVRVCPWTRPHTWQHNFVRWVVRHSGLARRIAITSDETLGFPEAQEKDKWWFDLEMVDGVLKIPQRSMTKYSGGEYF
jgi:reductive dehalogenase